MPFEKDSRNGNWANNNVENNENLPMPNIPQPDEAIDFNRINYNITDGQPQFQIVPVWNVSSPVTTSELVNLMPFSMVNHHIVMLSSVPYGAFVLNNTVYYKLLPIRYWQNYNSAIGTSGKAIYFRFAFGCNHKYSNNICICNTSCVYVYELVGSY